MSSCDDNDVLTLTLNFPSPFRNYTSMTLAKETEKSFFFFTHLCLTPGLIRGFQNTLQAFLLPEQKVVFLFLEKNKIFSNNVIPNFHTVKETPQLQTTSYNTKEPEY